MKKLLAGAGIILLLLVAYIGISFYGNPLSNILGKAKAQTYVENKYSPEFVHAQSSYNFKIGRYVHRFQVPGSLDKFFRVDTDSWGSVVYDDYSSAIENRFNTFVRFEADLRKLTDPIIAENFDQNQLLHGFINSRSENYQKVELDQAFSLKNIPPPLSVNINIISADTSPENLAKLFLKVEAMLIKNNLDVQIYSLSITNKDENHKVYGSINAVDIPYEQWQQHKASPADLAQFLVAHIEKWEQAHPKK